MGKKEIILTPDEIADMLKVRSKTVRDWLRLERLKGEKAGKLWRVKESDLKTFLKDRENKG